MVAMENIATPEWRAIEQSAPERHIFPRATALTHYLASKLTVLVGDMEVNTERMRENLDRTGGVWALQAVRHALMNAGVDYDSAYEYTQRVGFIAADKRLLVNYLLGRMTLSDKDDRTGYTILGETLNKFFDPTSVVALGLAHLFRK